jgi:hypothetical protein
LDRFVSDFSALLLSPTMLTRSVLAAIALRLQPFA